MERRLEPRGPTSGCIRSGAKCRGGDARRAGRAPNTLHMQRSLREAFPIPFGKAKMFVDDCRDQRHDRELDAQIRGLFSDGEGR